MVVLGLGGVTCSGKTSLARLLQEKYPTSQVLGMDRYFLPEEDPRHIHLDSVGHHNWEVITALDIEAMTRDAKELTRCSSNDMLVVLEGFLVLNVKMLTELCDAKVFIDLPYDVCKARRLKRSYNPPDVPGYFDKVVWPEAVKSREEMLRLNSDIHVLNGTESLDSLLDKITHLLHKLGLKLPD